MQYVVRTVGDAGAQGFQIPAIVVTDFAPVVVNIFAINISIMLTAFTAKRLFGNKKALFVLAFCALFLPYLTYLPYYYSDSMSMPFLIGAVYLIVSALQVDNRKSMYA